MKVKTAHFGTRDIDAESVITFEGGLPGLGANYRFALLPEELDPPVFYFLQSVEDPDIAFTVSFAQKFGISFDDTLLTADEMRMLGLEHTADAVILLLISENRDYPHRRQFDPKFIPHITNPMVINPATRKGLYKALPAVRCTATISTVSEQDADARKSREDYLRFIAMMQAGIKAP